MPTSVSRLTSLLLTIVAIFSFAAAQDPHQPAADLIITNAKVWTVDKSQPAAQAVAVLGERIVAVGSNADVNSWRGPQSRVIDAQGKLLLPGFNDAHVHFVDGGLQLDRVQLNDAASPEEFKRRIAERARITPKRAVDSGRRLG
jgi:predicted amidohydrolase YtcJ